MADDAPSPLTDNPKYEKIQTLGRGAFGFVMLARDTTTQEQVAIKCLKRSEVNKYIEAEIVNHSMLYHPHVIQFKDVFLTSQYICIVMEYATCGTMFKYVQQYGRLKEAVARWFFQQLVLGVDYCHTRGIANRDIKLENTLLQANRLELPLVKICDFGYSKADFKSAAKSKVGTLTYMAPEVLIPWGDGLYDGKVADIWSCGVMLYAMLCGRYPFSVPSPDPRTAAHDPRAIIRLLEKMVRQSYPLPDSLGLSPECRDLLQRMLLPVPANRITLRDILAHPWFNTNLPPEAIAMNSTYLQLMPPPRFIERVKAVIHEARQKASRGSSSSRRSASASTPGSEQTATEAEPSDLEETAIDRIITNAIREHFNTEGKLEAGYDGGDAGVVAADDSRMRNTGYV